MKVWRNSEGREFISFRDGSGWVGVTECVDAESMRALGYELVEIEPESFVLTAFEANPGRFAIYSPDFAPGKKYRVTEVEE